MDTNDTTRTAEHTLVCLHCSASDGRQWSRLAEAAGPRIRVVAPDLIGYGTGAGWRDGGTLRLDDEVDRLAASFAVHPEGVHLLGHSYGGAVALRAAMRRPGRVRSLTLYEPVCFSLLFDATADGGTGGEVVRIAGQVRRGVARGATREAAEAFVDYWSGRGTWLAASAARQAALAGRMAKVGAEFAALLADRIDAGDCARLTMPVRLVGGDRSPASVGRVLDRLGVLLPQARRTTLPGLGHMGPIQAPDRILGVLDDVLFGHRRGMRLDQPLAA